MKQVVLLFCVGLLGFCQAYSAATPSVPQDCGRRKVERTELVVSGAPAKPGDWPWHAAIYTLRDSTIKYVCGGTLISKNSVLTAAQCVTPRGTPLSPDLVKVVLGKYSLKDGDKDSEEKQVYRIIVHEYYRYSTLSNDIALLKLRTEVSFTDYIQPACVWYRGASDLLKTDTIMGTVVGWSLNTNDASSETLHQVTMSMVSEKTCVFSKPEIYSAVLRDGKTFCAGYQNGTSACIGDGGAAFQVFVPDSTEQSGNGEMSGAWYVRGIVSIMVARADAPLCDPTQYTVFTDVAQYIDWIDSHLDD